MKGKKIIPRGIRNNNPLNIIIGNTWLGERANPTDDRFEEFTAMEYGCRAAFIILRRYIRRYHKNTVAQIVHKWSPDGGTIEDAYIRTVCSRMGIDKDQPIDYNDKATMCALVAAMAFVENGQTISEVAIEKGYQMA